MPVQVTHPGVYVEEIPSSAKTVSGVSTSTGAFVDFFARGPMSNGDQGNAVQIFSFRDFQRTFGGLHTRSEGSYAIMQFFNNGGQTAFVARTDDGSGSTSKRFVDVHIPFLDTFARDARDAAEKAARAALRAQMVVNASRAVSSAQNTVVPELAASPAALAAAAALPDGTPATYDELAAVRGQLRRVVETSQRALDQASKAKADTAAAQAALDAAIADFEAVDLRSGTDDLAAQVTKSLGSAKAAATACAEVAKASDAYPPATMAGLSKATDATDEAIAALEQGYYLTGLAATRAADAIPEPGGDTPVDAVVTATKHAFNAARSAVDLATTHGASDEDGIGEARDKLRLAQMASKRVESSDSPSQDDLKAAVTHVKEACAAAAGAVTAVQDKLGDMPATARALERQLTDAREKEKAARDAVSAAGDGSDVEKLTAAVQASLDAKQAVREATKSGVALLPNPPGLDESGWPDVARAAQAAADETQAAADATRAAGDATEAASKVLAERVLEDVAAHGSIAEQTRKAAADAAAAADGAKTAADEAARQAGRAAKQVRIGPDAKEVLDTEAASVEEANDTVIDALNAAEAAADAAQEAADRSVDAHIAAMAAGEAGAPPRITIESANPGIWGNSLRAVVLNGAHYTFDLQVQEVTTRNGKRVVVNSEVHPNLSLQDKEDKRFALKVVNERSNLVRLHYKGPVVRGARPIGDGTTATSDVAALSQPLKGGRDGNPPGAAALSAAMRKALDDIAPSVFNILCLPITATYSASEASVAVSNALRYCEQKRAFMIVDVSPNVRTVDDMKKWMSKYGNAMNYSGATYFPRLAIPDPVNDYRLREVGPSGTMAGIYARTDTLRGIWKAPAGVEAVLQGAELTVKLTDDQNGQLNPLGVNVLRSFPVYGNICWGARTLAGADALQSGWKYINVRRLVDYIEESLFQALKWAVFEGNAAPLWHEIRQQVGAFLAGLFAAGAFAGPSADSSFFVHCDETTTTPDDIERGIVNIIVGVAPIKPAEFIVLQIEQIAGQE